MSTTTSVQHSTFTGTCMCEAVKFTINGDPEITVCCYCKHCQLNASAPGQYSARFKTEQVSITEGPSSMSTWILKDTQSGKEKHKVFCKQCGCTLWTVPMKFEGKYKIVRTALIEDGLRRFKPTTELFKENWEGLQNEK